MIHVGVDSAWAYCFARLSDVAMEVQRRRQWRRWRLTRPQMTTVTKMTTTTTTTMEIIARLSLLRSFFELSNLQLLFLIILLLQNLLHLPLLLFLGTGEFWMRTIGEATSSLESAYPCCWWRIDSGSVYFGDHMFLLQLPNVATLGFSATPNFAFYTTLLHFLHHQRNSTRSFQIRSVFQFGQILKTCTQIRKSVSFRAS